MGNRKPLDKKELTIRQKQILRYIIRQIDKKGRKITFLDSLCRIDK